MIKTQRIGIYELCNYNGKIVAIKKKRGPFTGKIDLPGGKIEHSEKHMSALKRELKEELGVKENDIRIGKIFGVWEDFSQHSWKGDEYDEHIIAIVYEVDIFKLDDTFIEKGGDSEKIVFLELSDTVSNKTNIFQKVLEFYNQK